MTLDIKMDTWTRGRTVNTRVAVPSTAAADAYFARCLPFHEASHCLVALHHGLAIRYVTIRREEAIEASGDPDAAGYTALASYAGEAGVLACVAFAGIVSDATFGFPGVTLEGDQSAAIAGASCHAHYDFKQFRELLPIAADQRTASLLCHEILLRRRADVIALGTKLTEVGRVSGEEAQAILRTPL